MELKNLAEEIVKYDYEGVGDEYDVDSVVWWKSECGFYLDKFSLLLGEVCLDDVEVIGNIYENPELLNTN